MARTLPLRTQLLVWQLGVVGISVVLAGAMAMWIHTRSVTQSHWDQLRATALAVAALPTVLKAFDSPDPAADIQQVAELVRRAGDISLVVITDSAGRRYSHPNPALIGTVDPFDPGVPGAGDEWRGRMPGLMGDVLRVKVPIYGPTGAVIGSATAAQLTSAVTAEVWREVPRLIPWLVGVGVAGVAAARAVSAHLWRRVHRQEPGEIARAVQAREAVLHAIGDAVIVVDAAGLITLVNDQANRMFGLTDADVGRPASELLEPHVLSVLEPDAAGAVHLALVGERFVVARRWWAHVEGQAVGAVLVASDRTELRAALDGLAGARDQAEALRSQAHEFAGRMHVIAGLLELGEVEEARGYVSEVCLRGAQLEQSLESVAEPRLRALLLAKTAVAAEREITVSAQASGGVGHDPGGDLATVVSNLVDNAMDAVGPGGHVAVTLRAEPGTVAVRVSDDGPGIDPQMRQAILAPGFSTKGAGRGFGLALVGRIVRRRAGSIDISSTAGRGTTVLVRLPEVIS